LTSSYTYYSIDAEIAAVRGAFISNDCSSNESTTIHVGSVKPNIGHLESASGIAGLIKAISMLENDAVPPSINLLVLKEGLQGAGISVGSLKGNL